MCCFLLLGNGEVGGQQEVRRDVLRWSAGDRKCVFCGENHGGNSASALSLICFLALCHAGIRKNKCDSKSEREVKRMCLFNGGILLSSSPVASCWSFSSFAPLSPLSLLLSLADLSFGRISGGHDLRFWFKHPRTNKHRNTNSYCLCRPSSLLSPLCLASVSFFFLPLALSLSLILFLSFFLSVSLYLCTVGGRQRKPHGWAVGMRRAERYWLLRQKPTN